MPHTTHYTNITQTHTLHKHSHIHANTNTNTYIHIIITQHTTYLYIYISTPNSIHIPYISLFTPGHVHTHIYIKNTYIHAYIHKYKQKYIRNIYQGKNIDIKIQKLIPNLKHKYIKTCISIYIHIYMHKEIYTKGDGERGGRVIVRDSGIVA